MRKLSLFAILFFLLSLQSVSAQNYKQEIREKWEKNQKLAKNTEILKEWSDEQILKEVYPPLIDQFGGPEAYLELARQMLNSGESEEVDAYEGEEYEEDGEWTLLKTEEKLGEIGPVYEIANELQVRIEKITIDYFENREEVTTQYQLAISRDNGKHWYFLPQEIKWSTIVPNLHPSITQPEEKNDIIMKD